MNYKDIIGGMKENNFERVYLLYGKEYYLLENLISTLKSGLNESMLDFNFDIIDGKEVQLDQLLSSIETFPFMDDRKVVIVKDFEILTGNKKNFSDTDEKYLIEKLDNIPESTVLAFVVYGDVDKRKSIYKKINKVGKVCECKKLEGMDLFSWVKRGFLKLNVEIENATIAYFIEQLGYKEKNSEMTLSDVKNEIFKIASYTGENNLVTNDIIERLSPRKIENNVFKMVDNIGMKRADIALKIFKDMILDGESPLKIMALIARQFRIILKVKDMQNENMKFKEIASSLGLQEFVVKNASRQGANFSEDILTEIINYILESEFKIKNGLIGDEIAIEVLISKYCK
ncbi:DNA polymerase III subunit delta [Peptacetobacter sp.]|uniref:DNA polymerase III subunit delta n=2 Tax=Peptacetobacter sp. TaxID=2991975 RepID=UPI0026140B61|nr:DNA polymerase III subunit delta [Peptacetobacter sp.]